MTAFYIFIAGGLGAVSRFLLSSYAKGNWGEGAYLMTGFINILGAFLIGIIFSLGRARGLDLHPVIATGFLGGFTTFSAFGLEVELLVSQGRNFEAAGYAVGTILLGVLAARLGQILVGA